MFKNIVLGIIDIIGIMYLVCIAYLYVGTLPVNKNDESTTTIIYRLDPSKSQEADLKTLAATLKEENGIRHCKKECGPGSRSELEQIL